MNKRKKYVKHKWTAADDAKFRTHTNAQLAKLTGVSYATVQQRRVSLGMPLVKKKRRNRHYRKIPVVTYQDEVPRVESEKVGRFISFLNRLFYWPKKNESEDKKSNAGRKRITCSTFPKYNGWHKTPSQISRDLVVSFYVAKRLKHEALALRNQSATFAADEKNKNRNSQR